MAIAGFDNVGAAVGHWIDWGRRRNGKAASLAGTNYCFCYPRHRTVLRDCRMRPLPYRAHRGHVPCNRGGAQLNRYSKDLGETTNRNVERLSSRFTTPVVIAAHEAIQNFIANAAPLPEAPIPHAPLPGAPTPHAPWRGPPLPPAPVREAPVAPDPAPRPHPRPPAGSGRAPAAPPK